MIELQQYHINEYGPWNQILNSLHENKANFRCTTLLDSSQSVYDYT